MDWNERYLSNDTPWDKGEATPVLAEMISRHPLVFSRKKALVPGCGAGHDARLLATTALEVTGVDIAPLAIQLAGSLNPGGNIHFETADFLTPRPGWSNAFDLIWEHTCFCAIDPSMRLSYLKAASRSLKPGGILAGVFFINPEMNEGETGPPFGIPVPDLLSLLHMEGFRLADHWEPTSGYPGRIGRELAVVAEKIR